MCYACVFNIYILYYNNIIPLYSVYYILTVYHNVYAYLYYRWFEGQKKLFVGVGTAFGDKVSMYMYMYIVLICTLYTMYVAKYSYVVWLYLLFVYIACVYVYIASGRSKGQATATVRVHNTHITLIFNTYYKHTYICT